MGGWNPRVRRMRRLLFAALAAALLLPVSAADAKKKHKKAKAPSVTVMTRNLFLGADLSPAINAGSICEAIDAGGKILNDVDATNFKERAPLLAAEIRKAKPDLVGIQEAALWRFQADADFTGSEATEVRYDFLRELLDSLGGRYKVAVVQNEFDQELPADRDFNDATQDASLPLCGADEDGRLTMRDAILIRKGSKVKVSGKRAGHFKTRYEVNLGGSIPINVDRGWVSVEAKRGKKKFRFVNAHLEAFGDPAIREAQARELVAPGGPYRTKKQLIALGDFNTGNAKDRVGPGFTIPGDEKAYAALVGFGLTNLGTRQTCCFNDVIAANVPDYYQFDHTVDHVFAKPKLKQKKAGVTGANKSVVSPGGLLASDHGGLWSRLKLK